MAFLEYEPSQFLLFYSDIDEQLGSGRESEEHMMTKWWHCSLTNKELPSHGQTVRLIPIQGFEKHLSALNCSYKELGNT